MISTTHYVVVAVAEIMWIPILVHFLKAWRARRNPVSAAIAGLVGFFMFIIPSPIWLANYGIPIDKIFTANEVAGLLVAIHFHFSFWISNRRFPDNRTK